MKRLSLIILVAIFSISVSSAKSVGSVNDIFTEFSSAPNAESVNVNPFLMSIAKLFTKGSSDADIVKKINSVKVLDLYKCASSVKTRFADAVKGLSVKGYEELITANDNNDKVKILAKMKDDKITNLLIISYGQGDCCLVAIKGKFNLDDLTGVVNSQMPRHDDR